MKKIKGMLAVTIVAALFFTSAMPAFAFNENESRSVESFFIESKLLKGDGTSYGLENNTTRMEGTIILIRLLGKESEAQQMQSLPCQFTDVPKWAVGYANYAYATNISKGISDTLFGTKNLMTAQQFNTLLLRVIGYDDSLGDFHWNDAVDKANELGILPEDLTQNYEYGTDYTKRDLIETSFCYLEAEYKNQEISMIDQLVEAGVISAVLAGDYGLTELKWDSLSTNIEDEDYLNFELDGNKLYITGTNDDPNKNWILVHVNNKDTGAEKVQKVGSKLNGGYDITVPLTSLTDGEYYVDVYGNDERYHEYRSFILSNLILKVKDGEPCFPSSPAYGQNLRVYKGNQVENEDKILNLITRASKQSIQTINDLAAEITADCTSDYEKVQAIHDWIAENIYYDQDYADGKTRSTNIPSVSVLEGRYAVCSGYANLTKDLLSACGIPCKQVFGFALGISTEGGWDDIDLAKISPNHVWNEAYVDGRWMIIDTTWDSSNEYTGGKFTKGDGVSQLYFDTTMQFFSNTHKSMDFDGYY
ncbi:MAG: transglutaminase-like domain-containing protein [Bacillota bacterium]